MAVVTSVGVPVNFVVRCDNAEGVAVPDTNGSIVASSDAPAVGTATCNPDGSGGVFTPLTVGSANVLATDGKLNAAPYPITVQDLVPASLVTSAT